HANAFLPQRVAQHTLDLEAFRTAARAIADAALIDAHLGDAKERLFVAGRPADGAAQAIDLRLVVVLDRAHPGTRLPDKVCCEHFFFRSDVPGHRYLPCGAPDAAPVVRGRG